MDKSEDNKNTQLVTLQEAMKVIDDLLDFYVLNNQLTVEDFNVWQEAINLTYRYEYHNKTEEKINSSRSNKISELHTRSNTSTEANPSYYKPKLLPIGDYQLPSLELLNQSSVELKYNTTDQETVYLHKILESNDYYLSTSPLIIALGVMNSGNICVSDIAQMPHLLIAGATGTGKSVFLHSLIVSILYKASPDNVKMIMVDTKRLELGLYEGIPHLLTPIVLDPKRASNALKWAVGEMERRYKLLASYSVRNIDQYNQQVCQEYEITPALHPDRLRKPLPYIVIIIDELADLMRADSKDVETSITRLTQMARVIGIHLVIATQRPSADIITGLIKANFPSRISFRVLSKVDSRTILGTDGAETLLGQGNMLFLPPGNSRLVRVHGAYVGEREIQSIVEHIRSQRQPEYDNSIQASDEDEDGNNEFYGRDELFDEAIKVICQIGKASTSVLQRRLRIGYGRAAAIIEMMEREGYVGPPDGSSPRVVKQSAYEYAERLEQLKLE